MSKLQRAIDRYQNAKPGARLLALTLLRIERDKDLAKWAKLGSKKGKP